MYQTTTLADMARAGAKRGEARPTETRAAIVAATIEALAEVGFSGTSARAVAERAGIAPGGVFYHFGSMDDLLVEVFTTCLDRRIARLKAAVDVPDPRLPTAFTDAVRAEMTHIESRALLELTVGAIDSPVLAVRVREGLDASFRFTRQVVEQMLGDSPLAGLLPLDLVAQVATSAFFGLAVMELIGTDVDLDGMTDLVNTLLTFARGEVDLAALLGAAATAPARKPGTSTRKGSRRGG
jgi:AcrR family transcriptional regulator